MWLVLVTWSSLRRIVALKGRSKLLLYGGVAGGMVNFNAVFNGELGRVGLGCLARDVSGNFLWVAGIGLQLMWPLDIAKLRQRCLV